MIIDEIRNELEMNKPWIKVKGPISKPGPVEIWGEVKITSLNGLPIDANRVIDTGMEFRGQIFASGSLTIGASHQPLYRIDNCHGEEGLHQHERESISRIETKTIGEVLQTFFSRGIAEQRTNL